MRVGGLLLPLQEKVARACAEVWICMQMFAKNEGQKGVDNQQYCIGNYLLIDSVTFHFVHRSPFLGCMSLRRAARVVPAQRHLRKIEDTSWSKGSTTSSSRNASGAKTIDKTDNSDPHYQAAALRRTTHTCEKHSVRRNGWSDID